MVSLRRMFGPLHPVCQTLNDKPNKDGVDSTREASLSYDVWFDYYQKIVSALMGCYKYRVLLRRIHRLREEFPVMLLTGAADPRMRL